jgi:hypothetical protein
VISIQWADDNWVAQLRCFQPFLRTLSSDQDPLLRAELDLKLRSRGGRRGLLIVRIRYSLPR